MNERFITHFENNEATRSQSVLLELMTILGFYRKDLYLVGGWENEAKKKGCWREKGLIEF